MPQRDLFIEKDSAINEHIEQMRLSCTKSILERRDVVIVATVSAIYGIGKPESYHQMVMTLRSGDNLGQRDMIAQLVRMQYQRNDMEFGRGTFRVRGDTIDIFPAGALGDGVAGRVVRRRDRIPAARLTRSPGASARRFRASPSTPAATT